MVGLTDAQPGREGPAADVEEAPTVAHPDFEGPAGFGSPVEWAGLTGVAELGIADTVDGFAILMPAAFASLRSSFSSLFLSFSFRLSISS